ncbi:MAG: diacylglycerol kinase family lipid kinase [Clostridia bacterium]|nr:diacylglycerol kinase family lipid kinase [Clostridia bacterium]
MKISHCYIIFNEKAGKNKAGDVALKLADEIEKQISVKSSLLQTSSKEQDESAVKVIKNSQETLVVVLGGDGTVSSIIRSLAGANKIVPLAIYPCGTANDFASSLNIKKSIKAYVKMLKESEPTMIDVARVNEKNYAINAVGSGNFSNGVTVYNAKAKKFLGIFGYYFKCVKDFFKMKECNIVYKTESEEFSANTLMYYILNSKQAGGFKKLNTNASITDGKWDLIVVKKCGFFACLGVFCSILSGKAEKNRNIIVKRIEKLSATGGETHEKFYRCDIDGNAGPEGELDVVVLKQHFPIIANIK